MRPEASAEKSSTLLNSDSRCSPEARIMRRSSRCPSLSGPSISASSTSVKPRIAFRGVRSSWLTVVRNSLL